MKSEKTLLLNEISEKINGSTFLYLVDFKCVCVSEISELRKKLLLSGAQFHVVKNTIIRKIAENMKWPEFTKWLVGHTGIVFGGNNPTGVAKVLVEFLKSKNKLQIKGGLMDEKLYDDNAINELARLPDLVTLRAMFLSLLLTPYRKYLYLMKGVPQALLNVLQAKQN